MNHERPVLAGTCSVSSRREQSHQSCRRLTPCECRHIMPCLSLLPCLSDLSCGVQGPWIYAYAAYAMSACLPQACILIKILRCCAHAKLAPFACSSHINPCRSSSFVHTRRVLAPSHCLSRTGRRRRPNSAGGPEDDDISDDGNDGGTGGSDGGGDDFGGEPWYGDDDANSRGSFGLLGLWQTFCMCSLILVRLACFSFMLVVPNHSLLGVALLRWCSP